jgi:dolichol-phosphate mannosyltransferase
MSKYALPGWPKGGFDFVLLDRQVTNELSNIKEKNRHTLNLIYWLGYDRVMIPYTRQKRIHGKSQWTMTKKIKLFIDAFISFSYFPIRFISFVGLITAFLSFIYGCFVLISYLFGNIPIKGYTPIILVITFLLGLIMIMLGIIGEYLWRTLDETRSRPLYVVDEKNL